MFRRFVGLVVVLTIALVITSTQLHALCVPKAGGPRNGKSQIVDISVKNLAIVRSARLDDLSSRLTVVTGETGAGKR